MKIKDLIKVLTKLPPDSEIGISMSRYSGKISDIDGVVRGNGIYGLDHDDSEMTDDECELEIGGDCCDFVN